MKRLALVLAVSLALVGCAPLANTIVDTIERDNGATLIVNDWSWTFDPGETSALGVIFIAEGFDMQVSGSDKCRFTEPTVVRCDFGDVAAPISIDLTGKDIIAAANYRRTGKNTVYTVFFRSTP